VNRSSNETRIAGSPIKKKRKIRNRRNTSLKENNDIHLQEINIIRELDGESNCIGVSDDNTSIASMSRTLKNRTANNKRKVEPKVSMTALGQLVTGKPMAKLYTIKPSISPEIVIETWRNNDNMIVCGATVGKKRHLLSILFSATSSRYMYSFKSANLKPHYLLRSSCEKIKEVAGKYLSFFWQLCCDYCVVIIG